MSVPTVKMFPKERGRAMDTQPMAELKYIRRLRRRWSWNRQTVDFLEDGGFPQLLLLLAGLLLGAAMAALYGRWWYAGGALGVLLAVAAVVGGLLLLDLGPFDPWGPEDEGEESIVRALLADRSTIGEQETLGRVLLAVERTLRARPPNPETYEARQAALAEYDGAVMVAWEEVAAVAAAINARLDRAEEFRRTWVVKSIGQSGPANYLESLPVQRWVGPGSVGRDPLR